MKQESLTLIKNAYAGKKVFLTGHTGFKGSWMTIWLELLGARVMGYALESEGEIPLYFSISGDKHCHSVIGDIRDKGNLEKQLLKFQPDFVFHLAAQPLVRKSYTSPLETYETNVMGTANLLDAVRGLNHPCTVVIITTDKVYLNNEWIYPYRENEPLGGYDPYSASKAACELVVSSYRDSFFNRNEVDKHGIGLASARSGNVIGGGDWSEDRIVPDIIRSFQGGKELVIRNPEATRPWQYVLDPLAGYLILAANLENDPHRYGGPWNFGPRVEDGLTVRELVEVARQHFPEGRVQYMKSHKEPHEAKLLMLDSSKSFSELGWRSIYSSQMAMAHTVKWYEECNTANAYELCKREIEKFQTWKAS